MRPPGIELRLSVLGAKPLPTEPTSCPVSIFCSVLFYFVFMATDFFYLVLSLMQWDFIHRAWHQQAIKASLEDTAVFLTFLSLHLMKYGSTGEGPAAVARRDLVLHFSINFKFQTVKALHRRDSTAPCLLDTTTLGSKPHISHLPSLSMQVFFSSLFLKQCIIATICIIFIWN